MTQGSLVQCFLFQVKNMDSGVRRRLKHIEMKKWWTQASREDWNTSKWRNDAIIEFSRIWAWKLRGLLRTLGHSLHPVHVLVCKSTWGAGCLGPWVICHLVCTPGGNCSKIPGPRRCREELNEVSNTSCSKKTVTNYTGSVIIRNAWTQCLSLESEIEIQLQLFEDNYEQHK